jgi:hypothetical protein
MLEVLEIDFVEKDLHHLFCSLQLLNLLIFAFANFWPGATRLDEVVGTADRPVT